MTPKFAAGLVIPDLWQQEAIRALQQGKDVVVQVVGFCAVIHRSTLQHFIVESAQFIEWCSRHDCHYRRPANS